MEMRFLSGKSLSYSSPAGTLFAGGGDLPPALLPKLPVTHSKLIPSTKTCSKGLFFSSRQFGSPRHNLISIPIASSLFTATAIGSDTSVDTDDRFDDLFNKYGKVVYRSNDQKSASADIDDDTESLSFAVAAAKVASEVKAGDIRVLFVKPLVYWTRFFIIATAFSRPQIDAIGTKIRDLGEKQYGKIAAGDVKPNSWTLLDFGDVVVHIFLPQQRAFYNLEEFYGNATPIELPFENQNYRN